MSGLGQMTPLRRLCLAHGTTRKLLAAKAGLSLRALYNIEGGANPSDATLQKIAEALDLDVLYVADVLSGRIEVEKAAA